MGEHCPKCHADLDDGEIPENIRRYYGPPYRWSRIIGMEIQGTDRISYWRCPDCGFEAKSRREFGWCPAAEVIHRAEEGK